VISILLYFILGILLVQVGFPLLDGLTGLLLSILEAAKGYFSLKVTKYNTHIRALCEEEKPKNLIGFTYEEEPDEEIL
jgi:divalent metal cation (Fe/Co/Zn/Cd) transporter